MKKVLLLAFAIQLSITANAQLKVSSAGNVGIGIESVPSTSKFSVGGTGSQYAKSYFEGDGYTMQINSLGKSSNMSSGLYGVGLKVNGQPSSAGGHVGIHSSIEGAYSPTNGNGFAAGVVGIAGNGNNGYNYGVSGVLSGSRNGAGVFGSVGGSGLSTEIFGRYAGYFQGNVRIEGNFDMRRNHIYHLAHIAAEVRLTH